MRKITERAKAHGVVPRDDVVQVDGGRFVRAATVYPLF
jgi:hypothetical protein